METRSDAFSAELDLHEIFFNFRRRWRWFLAGLLLAEMGRLPDVGDAIECAGWSFAVVTLDGRRIDHVLATPLAVEE